MASILRAARGLVSKKKRRLVDKEDGFDLDLSYIADRLIAMGFPSEGGEAAYRNPMSEVQRFFASRHGDKIKVYNLCSERDYSSGSVFPHCARFPFDDHNPCPLEMVHEFCASVDQFLLADPAHVVAVHCKAGKGRTGLMVACYLLHAGIAETATEALQIFAQKRTSNGKGVTIPSQIRWVHYYEWLLRNALHRAVPSTTRTLQLVAVRLITVPEFDLTGGCDPYFTVEVTNAGAGLQRTPLFDFRKWQSSLRHYHAKDKVVDLDVARCGVFLRGNVHLEFLDEDKGSADDKMFGLWLHTGMVFHNYLLLDKPALDSAVKDKKHKEFERDFKCELWFREVPEVATDAAYAGICQAAVQSHAPAQRLPPAQPPTATAAAPSPAHSATGAGGEEAAEPSPAEAPAVARRPGPGALPPMGSSRRTMFGGAQKVLHEKYAVRDSGSRK